LFAERFPVVLIAYELNEAIKPAVFIRTAKPGLHVAGTIFRFDGVPLPLRAIISSPLPAVEDVLCKLIPISAEGR
jgi:formylmethanofuran dehydrogenase subunit B